MPLATDPNETVEIWLPGDDDKPDQRATFRARFLSSRERRALDALIRLAVDRKNDDAAFLDTVSQALALQLVGWDLTDRQGNAVPFEVRDGRLVTLDLVLTDHEMWDLCLRASAAIRLDELKKNISRSQRLSSGASSAPSATPIDAATNHQEGQAAQT